MCLLFYKTIISVAGADYMFLSGGGLNISSCARSEQKKCAPPPVRFLPPLWGGQSYNRGGQTFVTFINHDLVICVVLALYFFENSESQ